MIIRIDPETTVAGAAEKASGNPRAPGKSRAPAGQPPPKQPRGASGEAGEAGAEKDSPERDPEREALDGDVRELVAVAAQRDEYLALAQRTQADFENYRKRVARDADAAHERGVVKLVRELLPTLDNLDLALADAGADGREDGLLEGVRLVRSQLSAALARVGIEEFSPLGEPFDPRRQEAMAQLPAREGTASGTVLEVYQSGYTIGEHIIRPARVVVAA
jgi:molecular chaperone GrpE